MSSDSTLQEALRRLVKRFVDAWESDAALRSDVNAVLQKLRFEDIKSAADSATRSGDGTVQAGVDKLHELQQALSPTHSSPSSEKETARGTSPPPPPLPLVAERCRLKAEACAIAAERERFFRNNPGSPEQPYLQRLQNVIGRAKALPDCYLWMCDRKHVGQVEPEGWDVLGRNFENLAAAISLLGELRTAAEQNRQAVHDVLQLVAESQSAVRCGISAVLPQQQRFEDRDQFNAFEWLRVITQEEQHYVSRHMRIDDLADALAWQDLSARITALRNSVSESQRAVRQRAALLAKIKYETKQLETDSADDPASHWKKIIDAVSELLDGGMPPDNKDLREALLPVAEIGSEPADDLPEAFKLVLREIDSHLALQDRLAGNPADTAKHDSLEISRVRDFLAGRTVVLIGGDERPNSRRALCESLGLAEVVWITAHLPESAGEIEASIARPDVALVLLAVRWSGHGHAGVKPVCKKHKKPLVRLPGGYQPDHVATQIAEQCSAEFSGS